MDWTTQVYIFFMKNAWLPIVLGCLLLAAFIAAMILLPTKRRLVKMVGFYTLMGVLFFIALFYFCLLESHWMMIIPVYSTVLIALYGTAQFFLKDETWKKRINLIGLYTIMAHLAVFMFFPFLYMIFKSFMDTTESNTAAFFPTTWHPEVYSDMFTSAEIDFVGGFGNTIAVMLLSTVGTVVSACMCAYGFGRGKFHGKGLCFTVMMATIMLPGIVTQVPLFIMFDKIFGWRNTWLPIAIPCWFGGGAMNIFLALQFVRGISREMDEAAKIDGAGRMRIFFQIILPLLKPIIIFMVINCIMGYWKDFDGPLMYIANTPEAKNWQPLALKIYYMQQIDNSTYNGANYQMAAGFVMTVPMIVIFFIFQRQLVDGVMMGGVKG